MPVVTCNKCGNKTNSATSDYWTEVEKAGSTIPEVRATKCYAAFVDGRWVRGCSFAEADEFNRRFALKVIARAKNNEG